MISRPSAAAWNYRVAACAAALLVASTTLAAGGRVSLQATSATVANPGDAAQICVMLSTTGGAQVAGTQNDLAWDGTCATLADSSNCQVAGSHGKQLKGTLYPQGQDFSYRALILSLSDVEAMPDGPLYCCRFESEAEPGQCCTITLTNVGASDPDGKPLSVIGSTAKICTAAAQTQPGRGIGSINRSNQPLSASNAPPDTGPAAAAPAPAPAAPPGGAGVPPSQVLPGGGAQVENPAAAGSAAPPAAVVQLPTPAAAQASAPTAGSALQAALAPPTAAATAAATSAPTLVPTAPAPVNTPAEKAVAPTVAPTMAAAPPQHDQAKPAAKAETGGGFFGCQVAADASVGPVLGLGLLALIGFTVRRWTRQRTQQ